jgi:hypothetical protein
LIRRADITWHGIKLNEPDWRRWIDTFLDSPHDIVDWERAPLVPGRSYRVEPRSVVVLFAGLEEQGP